MVLTYISNDTDLYFKWYCPIFQIRSVSENYDIYVFEFECSKHLSRNISKG